MFFMSGSTLAYFCRYYLRDDGIPTACNQSFYFQRHIVEPFSTTRRESQIIYYDNLQMEARSCVVNKVFLRIMTKPTLVELQKVLGSGI